MPHYIAFYEIHVFSLEGTLKIFSCERLIDQEDFMRAHEIARNYKQDISKEHNGAGVLLCGLLRIVATVSAARSDDIGSFL